MTGGEVHECSRVHESLLTKFTCELLVSRSKYIISHLPLTEKDKHGAYIVMEPPSCCSRRQAALLLNAHVFVCVFVGNMHLSAGPPAASS